jgi:hypothetical protein
MIASRAKRVFLIIATLLAAGAFSACKETATENSPQKADSQTDKQRLIESRKELNQTRGELRDAVKSGESKEEIERLQKQVQQGRKDIAQDKKDIRQDRLESAKDQNEAKQGTNSSKDTQ